MSFSFARSKPNRSYSEWASCVCSSQRRFAVRPVLDCFGDELDAEPATAVLREHVDVRQIREGRVVRDRSREADQPLAFVKPDNARGLADQALDGLAWPPFGPVRLGRQEREDGIDIDASRIVVELEASWQLALHGECRIET